MIPRFKPNYGWSDWKAALTPSRGNIPKFEKAFAEKFGCESGVMFAHGRTGIYALMKIWGLKDAEVICPAYTCVVVPHAIVLSGNIPVFVDCEKDHYNMSLNGIHDAITEKTRAIIPTHLFGYPMDVNEVGRIVGEAEKKYGHRIYVIQDCAHSFGAKWKGELVSTFGDAAVFGLNISKIINSIFGGMVITQDKDLAADLRQWRDKYTNEIGLMKTLKRLAYFAAVNVAFNNQIYGIVNWLESKGWLDRFVKYYEEDKIDFPSDWDYYPSEIEARIGLNQLKKYDGIISERRKRAREMIESMHDCEDIRMLPFDEGATFSHIVGRVQDREKWIDRYSNQGKQLGILIEYSIPRLGAYKKFCERETRMADEYAECTINFPTSA